VLAPRDLRRKSAGSHRHSALWHPVRPEWHISISMIVNYSQRRMKSPQDSHGIFNPANEPYLGTPMLQQFDEMIVVLMDHHQLIGPWTRTNELNDLQLAACQLVPQTSSLLLGMRKMIRQAYLLPAAIMVRPIIERVATLSWLCENPEGVDFWHAGWKHHPT